MSEVPVLRTPRLVLRGWHEDDLQPFADLNADPEVMEHFPGVLSRQQSDLLVDGIRGGFSTQGFGLWAVQVAGGRFIGFTGLWVPNFEAAFTPCIEVGWRLARPAWGHGYATEAAVAALTFAFDVAGIDEVVSFTSMTNERSQRLMRRLGMTHDPADDFDHPTVADHPLLRRHVLYRLKRSMWRGVPAAAAAPGR